MSSFDVVLEPNLVEVSSAVEQAGTRGDSAFLLQQPRDLLVARLGQRDERQPAIALLERPIAVGPLAFDNFRD